MNMKSKRLMVLAALVAMVVTLGVAGRSFAGDVFDGGLTVQGEGDSAQGNGDEDIKSPELDLFGGDDEEEDVITQDRLGLREVSDENNYPSCDAAPLKLTIDGEDATDEQQAEVEWRCGDWNILDIDEDGTMHFIKPGTATVKATFQGMKVTYDVVVKHAAAKVTQADGSVSFNDAFSLDNGTDATVTLLEDVTLKDDVFFGGRDENRRMTLDLNGHTLRLDIDDDMNAMYVQGGYELTVKNGTIDMYSDSGTCLSGIFLKPWSKLFIEENATIKAHGSIHAIMLDNASLTTKGTITAEGDCAIKTIAGGEYEEINVLGGLVKSAHYFAISACTRRDVNIIDGEVKGAGGIHIGGGKLTVDGASIYGGDKPAIETYNFPTIVVRNDARIDGSPSISLSNRHWYEDDKYLFIEGGEFSDDVANDTCYTLPEGTLLTRDEGEAYYTLKPGDKNAGFKNVKLKPSLHFDGSHFIIDVNVENLPLNFVDEECTLKYWKSGEKDNPKTEQLGEVNCTSCGAMEFDPSDLEKRVHYRLYRKGSDEAVAKLDLNVANFACECLEENDEREDLFVLAQKAMCYGVITDSYFNDENAKENFYGLDEFYIELVDAAVVPAEHAAVVKGRSSIIAKSTASLSLTNTATVNFYFTPAEGHSADEIEVTIDGEPVVCDKEFDNAATGCRVTRKSLKDGRVLVQVVGVKPIDLDHVFNVVAGKQGDTKQINYSGLSYLYNKQNDKDFGIVCKALYTYHEGMKECADVRL